MGSAMNSRKAAKRLISVSSVRIGASHCKTVKNFSCTIRRWTSVQRNGERP